MLNKQRIASALAFNAIGELINKIGPFFVYSLAMQRLGAQNFGKAQLALSVLEMTFPWVMLASVQVGMIETGRNLEGGLARPRVMLPLTVGRCILGLIAMLVLSCLAQFYEPWHSFREILLPLTLILLPLTNEASCVILGTQKVKVFSAMQTCGRLLSLASVVLLVHKSDDSLLYAFLTIGANAFISFLTLVWSWNKDEWRWSGWSYFFELWKKALFLGIPAVLISVHDRMDLLFAKQLLGDHGAGVYAAPMRLTQGISNLLGPISIVFYAEMVRVATRENLEKHARLEVYCLISTLLPLALGGMILATPILQLIFGSEALPGSPALSILIWVPFFQCLHLVYGQQILAIKGAPLTLAGVSLVGLLSTAFFYYVLRDQGSLSAVATSALLGKVVAAGSALFVARRHVSLFRLLDFRSALIAGCVMVAVLASASSLPLLPSIAIGALSYIGTFLPLEWPKAKQLLGLMRSKTNT